MIGIGTPSSQSRIPRPIFLVLPKVYQLAINTRTRVAQLAVAQSGANSRDCAGLLLRKTFAKATSDLRSRPARRSSPMQKPVASGATGAPIDASPSVPGRRIGRPGRGGVVRRATSARVPSFYIIRHRQKDFP